MDLQTALLVVGENVGAVVETDFCNGAGSNTEARDDPHFETEIRDAKNSDSRRCGPLSQNLPILRRLERRGQLFTAAGALAFGGRSNVEELERVALSNHKWPAGRLSCDKNRPFDKHRRWPARSCLHNFRDGETAPERFSKTSAGSPGGSYEDGGLETKPSEYLFRLSSSPGLYGDTKPERAFLMSILPPNMATPERFATKPFAKGMPCALRSSELPAKLVQLCQSSVELPLRAYPADRTL